MEKYKKEKIRFQDTGNKKVIGSFDGGAITSDAGGLLLREIEHGSKILKRFSECFIDYRNWHEYSVEQLIYQRVYGLALGYEDLNDHDKLRDDPTLQTLAGGNLAGRNTLNRLELTPADADKHTRYKKIVHVPELIESLFTRIYIDANKEEPEVIVLDLDTTDDEIHGNQEGKYYNGYYGHYCYMPLFIFCGDFLLCSKLKGSNIDGAYGAKEEVAKIVKMVREVWPDVLIYIRGDSGFCRDEILTWCEKNDCEYVFGLAKNERLLRMIETEMKKAKKQYERTLEPSRVFKSFKYRTLDSWSKARTVVAKAEHLEKGENPRFIVTSLDVMEDCSEIYEYIYCQRGEMENRIKEMKRDLFSGRTSTGNFRSNQLRLWFSAMAYVLINELRRIALQGTELANAECGTIRNKILKLGASVYSGIRQIKFHFSESYPFSKLFNKILQNIRVSFA